MLPFLQVILAVRSYLFALCLMQISFSVVHAEATIKQKQSRDDSGDRQSFRWAGGGDGGPRPSGTLKIQCVVAPAVACLLILAVACLWHDPAHALTRKAFHCT